VDSNSSYVAHTRFRVLTALPEAPTHRHRRHRYAGSLRGRPRGPRRKDSKRFQRDSIDAQLIDASISTLIRADEPPPTRAA
jgi:hypothetical protein